LWNPAVENQATDRAFRIGQKRNVLVHKFVCQGTAEDRIDQLIESKKQLVQDVLEGGAELQLTEMSDADLLNLVRLDIHTAQES
jgi:SNF2 family DNA or RNA helicase